MHGNKKLITMLSRLSHAETYDFGLEMETALAKASAEQSLNVTPQIFICEAKKVFHMEWDNLNKITTNVHGNNLVNRTAGTMIREVRPEFAKRASRSRTLPIYKHKKSRSLKVDFPAVLPPVYVYDCVGPAFPTNASFVSPSPSVYEKYNREHCVWLFLRILGGHARLSSFQLLVDCEFMSQCPQQVLNQTKNRLFSTNQPTIYG